MSSDQMKMSMENWRNDTDRGRTKYSERNILSAILSTTNVTWTELGSNSDLRGVKM
jgi:hypothetical protein